MFPIFEIFTKIELFNLFFLNTDNKIMPSSLYPSKMSNFCFFTSSFLKPIIVRSEFLRFFIDGFHAFVFFNGIMLRFRGEIGKRPDSIKLNMRSLYRSNSSSLVYTEKILISESFHSPDGLISYNLIISSCLNFRNPVRISKYEFLLFYQPFRCLCVNRNIIACCLGWMQNSQLHLQMIQVLAHGTPSKIERLFSLH